MKSHSICLFLDDRQLLGLWSFVSGVEDFICQFEVFLYLMNPSGYVRILLRDFESLFGW